MKDLEKMIIFARRFVTDHFKSKEIITPNTKTVEIRKQEIKRRRSLKPGHRIPLH